MREHACQGGVKLYKILFIVCIHNNIIIIVIYTCVPLRILQFLVIIIIILKASNFFWLPGIKLFTFLFPISESMFKMSFFVNIAISVCVVSTL